MRCVGTRRPRRQRGQTLALGPIDRAAQARAVLAAAGRSAQAGESSLGPVAAAIRLEIAIAEVENAAGAGGGLTENLDPCFRLRTKRWALVDDDLGDLVPVTDPQLRMMTFDVSALEGGAAESKYRLAPTPRPRHVVAFAQVNGERREPLFVSEETARILELSDGTRTALEIVAKLGSGPRNGGGGGLRQIEELFVTGLLRLQDGRIDRNQGDGMKSGQTAVTSSAPGDGMDGGFRAFSGGPALAGGRVDTGFPSENATMQES